MSEFSVIFSCMKQQDDIFSALGNPVRRALLEHLIEGPMTAGALAAKFSLSRPAVSEHLAVLRNAGLVSERQSGRERHYSLDVTPMRTVSAWLLPFETYWRDRLANLKTMVEEDEK